MRRKYLNDPTLFLWLSPFGVEKVWPPHFWIASYGPILIRDNKVWLWYSKNSFACSDLGATNSEIISNLSFLGKISSFSHPPNYNGNIFSQTHLCFWVLEKSLLRWKTEGRVLEVCNSHILLNSVICIKFYSVNVWLTYTAIHVYIIPIPY
jgi:hypothetical protein